MIDQRGVRAAIVGCLITGVICVGGCGTEGMMDEGNSSSVGSGSGMPSGETLPTPTTFAVQLVPAGASGTVRVNFAVPLAAGVLADATQLRVRVGESELAAATRVLATYADGSARSVQVQVDADASATLTVDLGIAGRGGASLVPVTDTLSAGSPRVWAVLPADVLAASGVFGPVIPRARKASPWDALCDYDAWDTDAFLATASTSRDVWLYDRVTAMYRGYAITGAQGPLRSAYREAALYRDGLAMTNGVVTALGVPNAGSDLKYHYAQGVALHYLLTGDDRFREAAEAMSARVDALWDPNYDGSDEFWTERHAGFALLAHEWALAVTDDKAAAITARADEVAAAALAAQAANRYNQAEPDARCFAHTSSAHGEDWGGNGCSPWMSAILADGLDAHARRVGGDRAVTIRSSLAKLARAVARHGRDSDGRPKYWMGVGGSSDQLDEYEEHWGESAYIVALGWAATGGTDSELRTAADMLVTGLATHGEVGQVRSFNWQCRSAIMTPALLP